MTAQLQYTTQNTLLICSGGLDSVTLAYRLAHHGQLKAILAFNYNQRHKKELKFAAQCAEDLQVPFTLIDLSFLADTLENTALTGNVAVPDGHYAEQSMKTTEVPNRNVIFLTIGFAAAIKAKASAVAIAVHGGDHFIYPDCRPDFLAAFNKMEQLALEGRVQLLAPYAEKKKEDIVADGAKYEVPFEKTWSCYKGGEVHCGKCGTCVERQEAFFNAKVQDPTLYQDSHYWQEAVKNFHSS